MKNVYKPKDLLWLSIGEFDRQLTEPPTGSPRSKPIDTVFEEVMQPRILEMLSLLIHFGSNKVIEILLG